MNNGVCANVGCGNANRKNEVAATTNDNLCNFLIIEHHADECSVMLHAYRSNQGIDHAIYSLHQTTGRPPQKSLVRVQDLLRANSKRGLGCESIGWSPEFDGDNT